VKTNHLLGWHASRMDFDEVSSVDALSMLGFIAIRSFEFRRLVEWF
jgi:hypothetical protein